jgi:hypothetical protein
VSGLRASKHDYSTPSTRAGRLAELERFYRLDEFAAGVAMTLPRKGVSMAQASFEIRNPAYAKRSRADALDQLPPAAIGRLPPYLVRRQREAQHDPAPRASLSGLLRAGGDR